MKILLVSSFFPYPLFSGGQVRLYNLLRNLGKKHEITLICEVRCKLTREEMGEITKYCPKVKTIFRSNQWSLKNILTAAFSTFPFLMVGHTNPQMKSIIKKELISQKYDLIHCETFYIMQNLPQTAIPVVLVEHNIEYDVYRRWVDNFNFFVLRPLLYLDVLKIKYWEKYFWQKADLVVTVSDEEKEVIEKSTGRKVEVVPNGVDCDYFSEIKKKEPATPTIVFVGSFKWMQNIDAANFLRKNLWPKIKTQFGKKVNLWLVGNCIKQKIGDLYEEDISIEESVEDIRKVYANSTLLLAPLRIGGGTKFKILESLAAGLPIVTTKKGVEGLGSDTNGIIVTDSEEELVNETVRLLSSKANRQQISAKEKIFVREKFDWHLITSRLERIYEQLKTKEN